MGVVHSDTSLRLIDVASRMFAESSVDAVSIRSIARAAEVGSAAVHYHFHSKDGLVGAILDRHGRRVLADITERARSLGRQERKPTAREVMECVAAPYFELLSREPRSGREWLRIVTDMARADDDRVTRAAETTTQEVHSLVEKCFPAVAADRRAQATSIAVTALLSMVSFLTTPRDGEHRTRLGEPATQELVLEFVAGGLTAAISDSVRTDELPVSSSSLSTQWTADPGTPATLP